MSNFSLRLFTPTSITIVQTDSLDSLKAEFNRINNIYISEFQRCCEKLEGFLLDSIIHELQILRYEQERDLRESYNISTFRKDLLILAVVRMDILNLDIAYSKMILALTLPEK